MKFPPKVSIIIPVYNGSNYLKEAIDSALAQTYKNIEIIVVNDGSNDEGATDKIAKSYGKKIRYYNKKNGGVATALNLGIKKMTGEYFSWLSHDDLYYQDKIEKQVAALLSCKVPKIIYSNVDYINDKSDRISESNYQSKYTTKQLESGLFVLLNGMANGCSLLIPKSFFNKYGLFNESLRTSNDYEMWFRMLRKETLIFIPDTTIKYRLHEGQGTRTEKVYQQESDELWSEMIKNISTEEISKITGSLFSFYFDLSKRMDSAGLSEASDIARKKAKKIFEKSRPKISVIMPCYNSEEFLPEAINSVLSQTFSDFELIAINDSSTDSTKKILNEYAKKDFRIKIMNNKYDKGIAGGMNTGIDASLGEYITRMDSDDISIESRLEKQLNFLEKNTEYGLCSVNISLFGDMTNDSIFEKENAPLEWLFLWKNPMANAPAMYRTSIIRDNKLRFNDYKSAEDYDFLTRVVQFAKPYSISEVLYRYRVRSSSVFQSNIDETLKNSLKISRKLAEKITGLKPNKCHDILTVFSMRTDGEIDVIKASDWMKTILLKSKIFWSWNDSEYNQAYADANKRIGNLFRDEIIAYEKENNSLKIELDNTRGELNNLYNSKSWKLVMKLSTIKGKLVK